MLMPLCDFKKEVSVYFFYEDANEPFLVFLVLFLYFLLLKDHAMSKCISTLVAIHNFYSKLF